MEIWKKFIKNYRLSLLFFISFAIILISAVLVFIIFSEIDEASIVIYVDTLREISSLGSVLDLYKIVAFSGVIFLINLVLARELLFKEPFLAYILGAATLLFSSLIFIVIIDTILIN